MGNHKTGSKKCKERGKPVNKQSKNDETRLLNSIYGAQKKTRNFKNEKENQKKFYEPLD